MRACRNRKPKVLQCPSKLTQVSRTSLKILAVPSKVVFWSCWNATSVSVPSCSVYFTSFFETRPSAFSTTATIGKLNDMYFVASGLVHEYIIPISRRRAPTTTATIGKLKDMHFVASGLVHECITPVSTLFIFNAFLYHLLYYCMTKLHRLKRKRYVIFPRTIRSCLLINNLTSSFLVTCSRVSSYKLY